MKWAIGASAIFLSGVASDALAAEADVEAADTHVVTAKQAPESAVSIAALAGFGFGEQVEDEGVNRYGVGYGVRGGYTHQRTPVYVGGAVLRYAGGSGGIGEVNGLIVDGEVGYDVQLAPFILRPYVGLGVLWGRVAQSDNIGYSLNLHVVPAFLAQVQVAFVTVGVEARYEMALDWANALAVLGSIGCRL